MNHALPTVNSPRAAARRAPPMLHEVRYWVATWGFRQTAVQKDLIHRCALRSSRSKQMMIRSSSIRLNIPPTGRRAFRAARPWPPAATTLAAQRASAAGMRGTAAAPPRRPGRTRPFSHLTQLAAAARQPGPRPVQEAEPAQRSSRGAPVTTTAGCRIRASPGSSDCRRSPLAHAGSSSHALPTPASCCARCPPGCESGSA